MIKLIIEVNLDLGVVPGAEIEAPQLSSPSLLGADAEEGASVSQESPGGAGALLFERESRDRSPLLLLVTVAQESAAAPQSSSVDLLALGVLRPPPLGAAFAPVAQVLLLPEVVEVPQSSLADAVLFLLRGVDRPLPVPAFGQSRDICPS